MQSELAPLDLFLLNIIRPTKLLCLSPIVFFLSLYLAICYGLMYMIFTSLTVLFERQYNVTNGNVGLTFIGLGVGQLFGLIFFGTFSDRILKKMANGGEMKPEYRLPPLIFGGVLLPLGLFL
jgi:MFS family permease